MELTPIKTKRLYEEIVDQIKHLIAEGKLKPGDKLLAERDLADRFQVSRASVREAIRTLEMLGIIDIRPGEGTFVRGTETDDIIRPLAMFLAVERNSLLDMFEMRRIFETATASLAAQRATFEELDQIESMLANMRERLNLQDSEKGEEFDAAFHYAVAEATHNSLLTKLFKTVSEEFAKANSVARRQLYQDNVQNAQRIIDQHSEILQAIRSGSPQKASEAMLAHLNFAEGELRKWIV
ncbi:MULTISPECIES: FadR/GntR family transcriptional regulator [Geothrix]|uniref:FadR/GntR family transcriptional regulator n=1 Tax=Geothrix TaxID=44675 RepID=UPI001FABF270|nr:MULTISPECIES: FadR/GntR family transcriptional regulator [Geothrix]HJV37430.1 FadR/GntR family transcriptional regulator [Geothrix sp.]